MSNNELFELLKQYGMPRCICGTSPHLYSSKTTFQHMEPHNHFSVTKHDGFAVECPCCMRSTERFYTGKEAILAWLNMNLNDD